jgi:hypothetical protein
VQTEFALVIFRHYYFEALQMKKRAYEKVLTAEPSA